MQKERMRETASGSVTAESAPVSRPFPAGGAPSYRIFLSLTYAEAERVDIAVAEIWQKSYAKDRWFVVGSPGALDKADTGGAPWDRATKLPLREGSGHDEAFSEICDKFQDCDFVFVKASTVVPEYWDLRIAWEAMNLRGAATVSPIYDKWNDRSDAPSELQTDAAYRGRVVGALDRICYESSVLDKPQVEDFFQGCFYVCTTDLRETGVLAQCSKSPATALRVFAEMTRKLRYAHALADHVCVGSLVDCSRTAAIPGSAAKRLEPAAEALNLSASIHGVGWQPSSIVPGLKPRHLHVIHAWGGGAERWVREYCNADEDHHNFILKSLGTPRSFGQRLELYRNIDDPESIGTWLLSPAINGTVPEHSGYEAALSEIIDHYGIDRILVSSLIGHSLGVFKSNPPVIMICHDYYPFCPALNITFDGICRDCSHDRLSECTVSNPHNSFFHNLPPSEWMRLRKRFAERIISGRIPMVAPAPSVQSNYVRLLPELADHFRVIPHGVRPIANDHKPLRFEKSPFRVVILGRLSRSKGLDLFRELRGELVKRSEVFLVGCGEECVFASPGVTVIPEYDRDDLAEILGRIRPTVGLLLSVVPETFSYTLEELQELAIPVVATRMGSFEDRIEHGVTGYLCEPTAASVLRCLKDLSKDPDSLARVHENLRQLRIRPVAEMLEDYQVLLESSAPSPSAYFCADVRKGMHGAAARTPSPEQDLQRERLLALAEADVHQLQQQMLHLEETTTALLTSRSWKITLPLRVAGRLARRVATLPRRVIRQVMGRGDTRS